MPFDISSAVKLPFSVHTIPAGPEPDTTSKFDRSTAIPVTNDIVVPHENYLAGMKWDDLTDLRTKLSGNLASEIKVAPYEHRAYARERAHANALEGSLIGGVFAPGCYAAKKLGLMPEDTGGQATPADIEQVKQGLIGAGEGLLMRAKEDPIRSATEALNPLNTVGYVGQMLSEQLPGAVDFYKNKLGL